MKRLGHSFREFLNNRNDFDVQNNSSEFSMEFSYNGLNFGFETYESDPFYFRLFLPRIFMVDDSTRDWVNRELIKLAGGVKVAKSIIVDDAVWGNVDQYVYSDDNLEDLFMRCIETLRTLFEEFRNDYFQNIHSIENGNQ